MGIIVGVKKPENEKKSFFVGNVVWLEGRIKDYGNPIENSRGFIFAGKSTLGAAIDISRTVIRRAERCAVRHFEAGKDDGKEVITYLNRLSSLLFVMRLFTDLQ
jgi:cob(I)alamin adenosyltransferase